MKFTLSLSIFLICELATGQLRFIKQDIESIGRWSHVEGDFGDLDNDGDLDIIISGYDDETGEARTSVFENNNGEFIEKEIGATNVTTGDIKIGDINGDDLPDVIITGTTYFHPTTSFLSQVDHEEIFTEVFLNKGNWEFEIVLQGFNGFYHNTVNIVDFNNDGKNDIFLSGVTYNGNANVLRSVLYRNMGNSNFEEILVSLPRVVRPESDWYDYDQDGYPDLIFSGKKQDGSYVANIMKNTGEFTKLDSENRVDMFEENGSSMKVHGFSEAVLNFVDLNNDGLKDIVQTGRREVTIYANRSDGVFEIIESDIEYSSTSETSGHFRDIDGDGLIDLLLKRDDNSTWGLMINEGNFNFNAYPSADVVNGKHTNVGTFGMIEDFNKDGLLDILVLGWVHGSKSHILYSTGGIHAVEVGKTDAPLSKSKNFDMDADGDLDIIATSSALPGDNSEWEGFYLFENNGDISFTEHTLTGLPLLRDVNFDIGDFNRDGRPDIFLTGLTETREILSELFVNRGQNVFEPFQSNFHFPKIYQGSVKWFDYDHDGDLDLFYTGAMKSHDDSSSDLNPHNLGFKIFKNVIDIDGSTSSFLEINNTIEPTIFGNIEFVDTDNDGYEELLTMGNAGVLVRNSGWPIMNVYKYDHSSSGYTISNAMNGLRRGEFSYGDLNLDGYPDLVLSGLRNNDNHLLWLRNIEGRSFEEISIEVDRITTSLPNPSVNVVDFNLNGRPDVVITGEIRSNNYDAYIIENLASNDQQYPEFESYFTGNTSIDKSDNYGQSSIGDFDNDGGPDFMMAVRTGDLMLFRNLNFGIAQNAEPLLAPDNIEIVIDRSNVNITWDNPNDQELTYNIYLDDGSSDVKIFETLVDERFKRLKTGAVGNINVTHYQLGALEEGQYQIKILGVTSGLRTTPFSQTISFELDENLITGFDEDKLSATITVYPNPTDNKTFYIRSINQDIQRVEIYDTKGSLANRTISYSPETVRVDLMQRGLYLVRVELVSGKFVTKKVIMR